MQLGGYRSFVALQFFLPLSFYFFQQESAQLEVISTSLLFKLLSSSDDMSITRPPVRGEIPKAIVHPGFQITPTKMDLKLPNQIAFCLFVNAWFENWHYVYVSESYN